MKGHAFDAYTGAQALVEGNVFSSVAQPATAKAATISTFIVDAGSACSSALGRACLANSVDSASGELVGGRPRRLSLRSRMPMSRPWMSARWLHTSRLMLGLPISGLRVGRSRPQCRVWRRRLPRLLLIQLPWLRRQRLLRRLPPTLLSLPPRQRPPQQNPRQQKPPRQ